MKIVVDAMGGDFAPDEIVKGSVLFSVKYPDIKLVLTGDKVKIDSILSTEKADASRFEVVNTTEIITNDDVPTVALRTKKDSSLVRAFELLKNDEECVGMVSAGSTGAVLSGATLKVGRIKGISRPTLAPELPTLTDGKVLLIDCGANVDCKSNMLVQFAIMGNAYMQCVHKIAKPRIGLLSNGTEDKKGNQLTKEVFALLKEHSELNFVGNMEARDILSGEYDVVVADGFYGNIALKSCEGTAVMMLKLLKNAFYSSLKNKLAAAMLKKSLMEIKNKVDYNQKGGALFVGVTSVIIKAHGASKAKSVCGALEQVKNIHDSDLIRKIESSIVNSESLQ